MMPVCEFCAPNHPCGVGPLFVAKAQQSLRCDCGCVAFQVLDCRPALLQAFGYDCVCPVAVAPRDLVIRPASACDGHVRAL